MGYARLVRDELIIDGNNLLYAVKALGPPGGVGRAGLLRLVEHWLEGRDEVVTLVFDGSTPRGVQARLLRSAQVRVVFSKSVTADDVIIDLMEQAPDPRILRIVSDDGVIRKNARLYGCQEVLTAALVEELFPGEELPPPQPPTSSPPEKPEEVSPQERRAWLEEFGFLGDQSPDEPGD